MITGGGSTTIEYIENSGLGVWRLRRLPVAQGIGPGILIQYEDGLQIETGEITTSVPNIAIGSLFRSNDETITFAGTYVEVPSISAFPRSGHSDAWASIGVGPVTTTAAPIRTLRPISGTFTVVLRYTVIGKWY